MDTFCEDFTNLFGEELDFHVDILSQKNKNINVNLDFGFPESFMEKYDDSRVEEKYELDGFKSKLETIIAEKKEPIKVEKALPIPSSLEAEKRILNLQGRTRAATQPTPSTDSLSLSQAAKEARWKSWAHEEEVFLVGAVMDRFFRRGSLSSTRGSEEAGTDDCWAYIKQSYDKAWERYTQRTGEQKPTERSIAALSRHYKVMKARISAADLQGDSTESFREYYNEFEMMYNINNSLMGNQDISPRNSPLNRIDRRKRKVRLSFNSRTRFDGLTSRRDSALSTASCGTLDSTTSSSGSFFEEGGYVIKEENKFDEEEEYE